MTGIQQTCCIVIRLFSPLECGYWICLLAQQSRYTSQPQQAMDKRQHFTEETKQHGGKYCGNALFLCCTVKTIIMDTPKPQVLKEEQTQKHILKTPAHRHYQWTTTNTKSLYFQILNSFSMKSKDFLDLWIVYGSTIVCLFGGKNPYIFDKIPNKPLDCMNVKMQGMNPHIHIQSKSTEREKERHISLDLFCPGLKSTY